MENLPNKENNAEASEAPKMSPEELGAEAIGAAERYAKKEAAEKEATEENKAHLESLNEDGNLEVIEDNEGWDDEEEKPIDQVEGKESAEVNEPFHDKKVAFVKDTIKHVLEEKIDEYAAGSKEEFMRAVAKDFADAISKIGEAVRQKNTSSLDPKLDDLAALAYMYESRKKSPAESEETWSVGAAKTVEAHNDIHFKNRGATVRLFEGFGSMADNLEEAAGSIYESASLPPIMNKALDKYNAIVAKYEPKPAEFDPNW